MRTCRWSAITLAVAVVGGSSTGIMSTPAGANDGLKEILERGVIRMGIRTDKRPFGYLDAQGNLAGMDAALGREFAQSVGVKLEFVPVTTSNRMQFLQQGRIDFFSAQMSDTIERRRQVGVVHPAPYSLGVNALTRKKDNVRNWEDLRGKTACATQGAWYLKDIDLRWGIKSLAFKETTESFAAYEDGRCQARIGGDDEIAGRLKEEPDRYKDHEMALPSWGFVPVVMAVPLDQKDKALGLALSGFLYQRHASGRLLEMWADTQILPRSTWLEEQHTSLKDWMKKE